MSRPGSGADKPAVDPNSHRVYVAWTLYRNLPTLAEIGVSHSDDGGRTWSRPVQVRGAGFLRYAALAIAPDHTVYLAWDDPEVGDVYLTRSTDGGRTFGAQVGVVHYRANETITHVCSPGVRIPAQPHSCVNPNPTIALTHGRVVVTWGMTGANKSQDVFERSFSPAVKPEDSAHVIVPDRGRVSDQFWAASAADPTTDRLWVCFYDTRGDPTRHRVRYSCTDSSNGGRSWAALAPVASVPSTVARRSGHTDGDYGDYEGLAAGQGHAHPIWTDTRKWKSWEEEVFTATLSS